MISNSSVLTCKMRSTLGAYHILAKNIQKFWLKVKWITVIFWQIHLDIVDYLLDQWLSSFSVWNRTMEISLPFGKFSSFQSLIISRKQLPEIKFQMTTTISFGWFIDFGKTLTIVQRSSQPLHSDKWYAVNLCLAYRTLNFTRQIYQL